MSPTCEDKDTAFYIKNDTKTQTLIVVFGHSFSLKTISYK